MYTVKVDLKGAEKILKELEPGGKVQRYFTSEVMRISDPYVPFKGGALYSSARISDDGTAIIYDTPYAKYHWYGKLMVDPITKKGAFYNPLTGRFWSRKKVQKELTDRDLKYNGAPIRGPRWVERAWIDNGEAVIRATESYMNGGNP